jgi:hypothetical protein
MRIAQGRIIDPSLTRRVDDPLKEASKQTADSNGGTWSLMLSLTDVCVGLLLDDLYFHRSPKKDRPNLSSTVFLSSGLVSATSGKSFSHSYGLQASITAREFIKTFESGGIIGSRELDQHRRRQRPSRDSSRPLRAFLARSLHRPEPTSREDRRSS